MALSNTLREPRRELTEQMFGLVAAMGLIGVDALVAAALCWMMDGAIFVPWQEFICAMVLAIPAILGSVALIYFIHFLGEEVCDFLADQNLDPRPKQRR